jgi:hypothetical protein
MRCMGSGCIASHPCCFTPRERATNTHCLGSWVGPRAGLDSWPSSLLCLHQSYCSGFQWQKFLFLWVPKWPLCLSHSNSRLLHNYCFLKKTHRTKDIFKPLKKAVSSGLNSVQVIVTWSTVSQSVSLGVELHLVLITRYHSLFADERMGLSFVSAIISNNKTVANIYKILKIYILVYGITMCMYIQNIQSFC